MSRDKQRELRDLERIIIDGVSGMDPEDTIGSVKVWYSDGTSAYLVHVIDRANQLRAELSK